MKSVVYIESSVISYLVSRPSRDVIIAGRQALTLEWWENEKQRFDLRVSALVDDEIGYGDPSAAERRGLDHNSVQYLARHSGNSAAAAWKQ